jgi:cephalosporin hydroxylase
MAEGETRAPPDEVVRRFHKLYYDSEVLGDTSWLGIRTLKCPLDLWIYQEILVRNRPELIIETGTALGGTTYFLASICDQIDCGRITSIDWRMREGRPEHSRITYLHGSSIAPRIVTEVAGAVRPGERVMVILDSAHERDHVLEELRAYGPLVTPGQYLVVEDTNVNGHPVRPEWGPGPMEAVEAFLEQDLGRNFRVDHDREKFFMTFNPDGYLLRGDGDGVRDGDRR